ncbi:hypothetical protein ACQP04_35645 [Pseudonocardia halophobica]|uniref:hypothetical protein n=1 Tax=Pseudonocardia halophobica TaxID=29401 RepID=UPI003D8C9559
MTEALATAEMWAASTAGGPAEVLQTVCRQLEVPYVEPQVVEPQWAEGVYRTLRWLTRVGDEPCPLELPVRGRDGHVLSVDELVNWAISAAPHRAWEPEDRAALRRRAEVKAQRSQELAAVVKDLRRRAAS